jgi:hypothetical protein
MFLTAYAEETVNPCFFNRYCHSMFVIRMIGMILVNDKRRKNEGICCMVCSQSEKSNWLNKMRRMMIPMIGSNRFIFIYGFFDK